jgi:hypothetical protein
MQITHALGRTRPVRWRVTMAMLGVAFCATLALAIGGTASASAAGPAIIGPGADIIFPTWTFGGTTTVCAFNLGAADGDVTVDPFPWGGTYNTINAPANGLGCTSGSWWGNPVKVTNQGSTQMSVVSF